jgi:Radical SAM superfamily
MRILLVNPAIYDFSAYDYWLKPYGLLRVAGMLRDRAELRLFDYLDRQHPAMRSLGLRSDRWGRGEFASDVTAKPDEFSGTARRYRRFGLARRHFREFLAEQGPFDVALIQTVMSYWYLGVREVLDDIRELTPRTRTVLGGVYVTLCPQHARSLGADLVIEGSMLDPLWHFLGVRPDPDGLPYWEQYPIIRSGVLKLAVGCPFRCTYCSVPAVDPNFIPFPLDRSLAELELLGRLGVRDVAFYDDALLYRADKILVPFLLGVLQRNVRVHFHTPNALNARFISRELAELMVRAGFRTFYLGFESSAYDWQHRTGGKVYSDDLVRAVDNLTYAGADRTAITAYLIVGHPAGGQQEVEGSMRFAHELGIRLMLSEFSPIPGTPDGEACRGRVDLDEPLNHNKTAFTLASLGDHEVNRLKSVCKQLNRSLMLSPHRVVRTSDVPGNHDTSARSGDKLSCHE